MHVERLFHIGVAERCLVLGMENGKVHEMWMLPCPLSKLLPELGQSKLVLLEYQNLNLEFLLLSSCCNTTSKPK